MLICDREGYVDVALLCDSLLPLKFKLKYQYITRKNDSSKTTTSN